jgi:hypothetical protein
MHISMRFFTKKKKGKKLHRLSPLANYTDRATALVDTKLVPTFTDRGVSRGQHGGSLLPYYLFSGPEPQLFVPNSSLIVLTRLSGPRSRPTTQKKNGCAGNRTRTSGYVARNSDLDSSR